MKYVVADEGFAGFRSEVEQRYGSALREAVAIELGEADDHLGWRTLDDGFLPSRYSRGCGPRA